MPAVVLMCNMIIRQTILGNVRVVKREVFPYDSSRMQGVYDRLSLMWEKSLSTAATTTFWVYDRLPVSDKNSLRLHVVGLLRSHLIGLLADLSGRLKYFNTRAVIFIVLVSFQVSEWFTIRMGCNRRRIMCDEWRNLITGGFRSLILIARITMLAPTSSRYRLVVKAGLWILNELFWSSRNLQRTC